MTAKNITDSIIRKYIVDGDYQPIAVNVSHSSIDYVAPLDKRSYACKEIRNNKGANKPKYIIIHGTTPGVKNNAKLSGFNAYIISNSLREETKWRLPSMRVAASGNGGGSGHYTVFREGTIAQHVNDTDPVIQTAGYNFRSIGIEHHFIFGREPPTKEMYEASAKLVREIIKKYKMLDGKNVQDIVFPHDPQYDPGPYWDWEYYYSLIKNEKPEKPPRSKEKTESLIGQGSPPAAPNPSIGPRKKISASMELPLYKKDSKKEISRDEIENGILPFFIDEILKNAPPPSTNKPFVRLDAGKYTPFLSNMMFGKEIKDYKQYGSLTNIELSNFVPFVELYLIKENAEYSYPFDDFTSRAKIENIFRDKTGRGGAIGIKTVSWKSLATNQSNIAQQTVKISFLIQDIQEIEAKKNGISLLDFLYPAGSRDPVEYNANNFNVKMKVGWKYKNNPLTFAVDDKISKDLLEETMYLSLFKHSFEFNEKDGTVILNVEYIGMLETEISDNIKSNILPDILFKPDNRELQLWRDTLNSFNRWDKKSEITKTPNLKHSAKIASPGEATGVVNTVLGKGEELLEWIKGNKAQAVIYNIEGFDSFVGSVENGLSADDQNKATEILNKKIEEIQKKDASRVEIGYSGLVKELFTSAPGPAGQEVNGMNYIHISKENVSILSKLATSEQLLSTNSISKIQQISKNSIKSLKPISSQDDVIARLDGKLKNIQESVKDDKKVEIKNILNAMRSVARIEVGQDEFKTGISEDDIFIPYTFLENILFTFYRKVYGETKKLKIPVGQFSYNTIFEDIANRPQENQGGSLISQKKYIIDEDGTLVLETVGTKKYANILNIPITLQSFDNWYRSNIIDAGIKNMSFYDFVKKILFELVPQNLSPKIMSWTPEIDFTPSLNFETSIKQEGSEVIQFFPANFETPNGVKANPFYKFYKKRNDNTRKEVSVEDKVNYLFILSKNEINTELRGDPAQDAERNILHLYLGEETGLVKNIKFAREDNKQLDAANIVLANKTQGKPGIIRQIYQLNMDMFGNTIFYPGNLIHITPTYPGSRLPNSTLYKIGLGGYYLVTQISSRIEDNHFVTSINGKWQASGTEGPDSLKNRKIKIEISEKETSQEEKDLQKNSQNWITTSSEEVTREQAIAAGLIPTS